MREILFKAKLKDWKTKPNKNKWVDLQVPGLADANHCV